MPPHLKAITHKDNNQDESVLNREQNNKQLLIIDVPFQPPTSHQAQRLFHGRSHVHRGYEHVAIDWLSPYYSLLSIKSLPLSN